MVSRVKFLVVLVNHDLVVIAEPLVAGETRRCLPGSNYYPAVQKCCGPTRLLASDEYMDDIPTPGGEGDKGTSSGESADRGSGVV